MMSSSEFPQFMKMLECPVCLDIFRDPRVLQCQHTMCLACHQGLVQEQRIACPVCRAVHELESPGATSLPPNYIAVGILDMLCTDCRRCTPSERCSHCTRDLCQSCLTAHKTFSSAQASFKSLRSAMQKAKDVLDMTEPRRQCLVVEQLISASTDLIIQALKDRRRQLIEELRHVSRKKQPLYGQWAEQVTSELNKAKAVYWQAALTGLDKPYDKTIDTNEIHDLKVKTDSVRGNLNRIVSHPPESQATFKCDSGTLISSIATFGSIEVESISVKF